MVAGLGPLQAGRADEHLFQMTRIVGDGRTVSAHVADFDGDGLNDLLLVTLAGVPPRERRRLLLFAQSPSGALPAAPARRYDLPPGSAMYDVADVHATPGSELLALQQDGVAVLSLGGEEAVQRHLPVGPPSTVAAGDDERGFDRYPMVHELGGRRRLLVPQVGMLSVLTPEGDVLARLDTGQRANYFVANDKGLLSVESDVQLFLDLPRISVGDVDGDGLEDIVAATRHEIRVFRQSKAGTFSARPDLSMPLGFVAEEDHIRGSGGVVINTEDFDGDGRLDLMVTHAAGSFVNTVTTTTLYHNRDGRWNLDSPDQRFVSDGALMSDLFLDVDGDGIDELVRVSIRFSVLEIVELLLTREIDTRIAIHRLQPDGRYSEDPWSDRKIGTKLSFETFRPRGFMPRSDVDLDGDGRMDFVTSGDGERLEIWLGGDSGPFERRTATQDVPTAGRIHFGDIDGDARPDVVLYNPQVPGAPIYVGLNRVVRD